MNQKIVNNIAKDLEIEINKVKAAVKLLEEDNTIPFIARYRKEETGNLNEEEIREINEKKDYLGKLEKRRKQIIKLIAEQEKLTDELKQKIENAETLQELEDYYRPYKKKRKTRATKAINKGLKPLAAKMWKQEIKNKDLNKLATPYINPEKKLNSVEEVLNGARDIMAEWISDKPEIRKKIRQYTYNKGIIKSSDKNKEKDKKSKYKLYYNFKNSIDEIPPYRILALNRGEEEDILSVNLEVNKEEIYSMIEKEIIQKSSIFTRQLKTSIKDAYKRLIAPSIEREIRNDLTEKAEEHAIEIFSNNLRNLLLKPPYKEKVIMGIDPGYKAGCKVSVINERGNLLDYVTIYPHSPHDKINKSKEKILELINKHEIDSIAIGNGTAARETEIFISEEIISSEIDVNYTIVNEAGASVYSASKVGREEFPEIDVVIRGAISIARRLQDPLAELVKINPRHIGVGLYQHDIDDKKLEKSLENVVESVVNYVGVDLNTASFSLLKYVAGITSAKAQSIIEYRDENNGFEARKQLKQVYGIGPKTYKQAAGFLRIFNVSDPLARTPIHPESYQETEKLLKNIGYKIDDILDEQTLNDIKEVLNNITLQKKVKQLEIGLPTLKDIVKSLKNPGQDPREQLSDPVFKKDVIKMEDLKEGMILQGTVRNVVDFGVFVDIGVKEDGLIHISELSYDYIDNPLEVVHVGDIVKVKVIDIDLDRKRISLSRKF